MRFKLLVAMAATFLSAGAIQAQPNKTPEPTVELRVRSVNDLLDKGEFIGGLIGKDDVVSAAKLFLKSLTKDKTGIAGINPKEPFGLYSRVTTDVVNSPIVLMIPIADQERFLKLLKDQLEIVPEKAEDGTLKAFVPVVSELYLRFANGYLYISRTVKDLDPKTLVTPREFFAKDDGAIASLLVRLDTIPKEVKTFVLGQFELASAEQRKKNGANEDPAQKLFLDWLGDAATGGLDTFFEDSRTLTLKVFANEKTQELSAEASLTARKGSTLSKTFSSLAGKTSLPVAIVTPKDPVAQLSMKAGLPPELKARFAKMIAGVADELEKKADGNAKATVRQILDAVLPTFKEAELDAAVSLGGPDAKGRHTLLFATGVKNGKEIEKLLKDLSLFAGGVADFDFDLETIGDFKLHRIKLGDGPQELEQIFGTKTFWVAISDSCFVLSVEPEGVAIKAGLKNKPVAAPALSLDIAAAKVLPIIARDLKPDEIKAIIKDAFGEDGPGGKDKVTVTITGGDQLSFKVKIEGKAARMFFAVSQLKNK